MNYLDYTILVLVGFFAIKGLFKGFIHEVLGLAGLILSLVLATKFMGPTSSWIAQFIEIPPILNTALGFLTVFFAVMLGCQLIIHIIQKMAKWALLGWIDKLAGAVSGFLKGAIIVSLLLLIISAIPLAESLIPGKNDSKLYRPAQRFAPSVFNLIALVLPGSGSFYEEVKNSISGFSTDVIGEQTQKFLDSISDNDSNKQEN